MSYRNSRSSGYAYECPTEVTEVLCRVIPGVNTPGTVCTYLTEHNRANLGKFENYFSQNKKTSTTQLAKLSLNHSVGRTHR